MATAAPSREVQILSVASTILESADWSSVVPEAGASICSQVDSGQCRSALCAVVRWDHLSLARCDRKRAPAGRPLLERNDKEKLRHRATLPAYTHLLAASAEYLATPPEGRHALLEAWSACAERVDLQAAHGRSGNELLHKALEDANKAVQSKLLESHQLPAGSAQAWNATTMRLMLGGTFEPGVLHAVIVSELGRLFLNLLKHVATDKAFRERCRIAQKQLAEALKVAAHVTPEILRPRRLPQLPSALPSGWLERVMEQLIASSLRTVTMLPPFAAAWTALPGVGAAVEVPRALLAITHSPSAPMPAAAAGAVRVKASCALYVGAFPLGLGVFIDADASVITCFNGAAGPIAWTTAAYITDLALSKVFQSAPGIDIAKLCSRAAACARVAGVIPCPSVDVLVALVREAVVAANAPRCPGVASDTNSALADRLRDDARAAPGVSAAAFVGVGVVGCSNAVNNIQGATDDLPLAAVTPSYFLDAASRFRSGTCTLVASASGGLCEPCEVTLETVKRKRRRSALSATVGAPAAAAADGAQGGAGAASAARAEPVAITRATARLLRFATSLPAHTSVPYRAMARAAMEQELMKTRGRERRVHRLAQAAAAAESRALAASADGAALGTDLRVTEDVVAELSLDMNEAVLFDAADVGREGKSAAKRHLYARFIFDLLRFRARRRKARDALARANKGRPPAEVALPTLRFKMSVPTEQHLVTVAAASKSAYAHLRESAPEIPTYETMKQRFMTLNTDASVHPAVEAMFSHVVEVAERNIPPQRRLYFMTADEIILEEELSFGSDNIIHGAAHASYGNGGRVGGKAAHARRLAIRAAALQPATATPASAAPPISAAPTAARPAAAAAHEAASVAGGGAELEPASAAAPARRVTFSAPSPQRRARASSEPDAGAIAATAAATTETSSTRPVRTVRRPARFIEDDVGSGAAQGAAASAARSRRRSKSAPPRPVLAATSKPATARSPPTSAIIPWDTVGAYAAKFAAQPVAAKTALVFMATATFANFSVPLLCLTLRAAGAAEVAACWRIAQARARRLGLNWAGLHSDGGSAFVGAHALAEEDFGVVTPVFVNGIAMGLVEDGVLKLQHSETTHSDKKNVTSFVATLGTEAKDAHAKALTPAADAEPVPAADSAATGAAKKKAKRADVAADAAGDSEGGAAAADGAPAAAAKERKVSVQLKRNLALVLAHLPADGGDEVFPAAFELVQELYHYGFTDHGILFAGADMLTKAVAFPTSKSKMRPHFMVRILVAIILGMPTLVARRLERGASLDDVVGTVWYCMCALQLHNLRNSRGKIYLAAGHAPEEAAFAGGPAEKLRDDGTKTSAYRSAKDTLIELLPYAAASWLRRVNPSIPVPFEMVDTAAAAAAAAADSTSSAGDDRDYADGVTTGDIAAAALEMQELMQGQQEEPSSSAPACATFPAHVAVATFKQDRRLHAATRLVRTFNLFAEYMRPLDGPRVTSASKPDVIAAFMAKPNHGITRQAFGDLQRSVLTLIVHLYAFIDLPNRGTNVVEQYCAAHDLPVVMRRGMRLYERNHRIVLAHTAAATAPLLLESGLFFNHLSVTNDGCVTFAEPDAATYAAARNNYLAKLALLTVHDASGDVTAAPIAAAPAAAAPAPQIDDLIQCHAVVARPLSGDRAAVLAFRRAASYLEPRYFNTDRLENRFNDARQGGCVRGPFGAVSAREVGRKLGRTETLRNASLAACGGLLLRISRNGAGTVVRERAATAQRNGRLVRVRERELLFRSRPRARALPPLGGADEEMIDLTQLP